MMVILKILANPSNQQSPLNTKLQPSNITYADKKTIWTATGAKSQGSNSEMNQKINKMTGYFKLPHSANRKITRKHSKRTSRRKGPVTWMSPRSMTIQDQTWAQRVKKIILKIILKRGILASSMTQSNFYNQGINWVSSIQVESPSILWYRETLAFQRIKRLQLRRGQSSTVLIIKVRGCQNLTVKHTGRLVFQALVRLTVDLLLLIIDPRTSFSTDNKRYTESDQDQVKDEVKSLDCDEKLKSKLIHNPINSRMSVKEHQRNTTFSREKGEHFDESTNTTKDRILKATDDPTLQYDRKMELEKRAHLKGMKDPQQRSDYIHYYDAVIPSDKPLQDELHVEFLHKYRKEKAKDLEVPDRKLGAPLSTGEYGIIHGRWNPRPDGRGT
ncbi:hypothetical protein FGO68_gene13649 [Halteria grandinella]|uniref:Uncharacterized protein n=1 Tax=Halteria grandinella TaxID=5974 RepID=A0A8J8T269_HALGN|nr:hypothetical protein FGO68_gene13649 [Halteria grandinella]